ncbi:MAG: hypothetical protein A3G25_04195 [Betaproteobacteria bacterium RIFCSPLOWO2_12_FULL_63_13]|nr:MAG: hypothetical protein A3H32_08245 [Betaproteobacteria bacterium RIFCSPLOWO2_02_FULL_63_19]OGA52893.1 MAG: hypothetical protein A3G25_04195 [Betaproteobacteria bacterium RIFCSPLOWO2_12_FULL_63_13]
MKAFYVSLNAHEIHHLKNLLESAGIRCRLRNERLSTLAGEVPFTECSIQLVLENDADRRLASSILREMTAHRPAASGTWICANCGERLEVQFTACWNCGVEKR